MVLEGLPSLQNELIILCVFWFKLNSRETVPLLLTYIHRVWPSVYCDNAPVGRCTFADHEANVNVLGSTAFAGALVLP